ncbi:MAG: hypothetical protein P4L59_00495 [Desulfosporosinus sp.]|nr:hypothetical protein [Desulfosporosinus sp.]
MQKQSQVHKSIRKSWIVVGALLSLTVIGVSGCGSPTTTSTPVAPATQSSTSSQANQGKTAKQSNQNPALRAVMEIRRLQSNQTNALTTDQKDKIKPILQVLISTANPTQDILQQNADAINAVLTDQQKSYLTTRPNSQGSSQAGSNATGSNATGSNATGSNPNASNPNASNPTKGTGNTPTGRSNNPQVIYQQVLDSLK